MKLDKNRVLLLKQNISFALNKRVESSAGSRNPLREWEPIKAIAWSSTGKKSYRNISPLFNCKVWPRFSCTLMTCKTQLYNFIFYGLSLVSLYREAESNLEWFAEQTITFDRAGECLAKFVRFFEK